MCVCVCVKKFLILPIDSVSVTSESPQDGGGVSSFQGNLKGESVVVAVLPSHMEASYCTSRFSHS